MEGAVELPKVLLSRISSAATEIDRHSDIRVISHYDADGISSAGVICNALLRKGKRFQATLAKSLDAKMIRSLAAENAECLVLADMGSSYLKELEELDSKVIVLDHHSLQGDSEKVIYVNPHMSGIDGMTGCSASAVCMLLAARMSEGNWSLLPVAFGGIVGDRQHIRGLSGVNAYLLQEGVKRKIVEVQQGYILPPGPLGQALSSSIDPYIIGVSGNEKGAKDLLSEAGVPEDASLENLKESAKRKLASILTLMLLKQGCSLSTLEELSTDRYYFPEWKVSASDLASLFNACGRTDHEGIGLGYALRDQRSMEEATKLRKEYKRSVLVSLQKIESKGLSKMDHLQYFYSDNPSLSGMVCGLTMQYLGDRDRPTIALSIVGDSTRISSRATFDILAKGADLATGLREAAAYVGGVGGGHAIASGATIARGKEEEFLKKLNELFGVQKATRAAASSAK
ncbi:MAG: DHH family phosphoesterase [Methanomassiliicoccales archaeon]|nr:DHH family phosphoesterase [Methanomassiliicoccales archaeon]